MSASSTPVATAVEDAIVPLIHGPLPVRLECWDRSAAGPADAPVVRLNSPNALRRQLWAPGELGAAQAYVTGELDIPGDLLGGLNHVWSTIRSRDLAGVRPGIQALGRIARLAVSSGAIGLRRPPAPETQAKVGGRRHSRRRDRAAISHHYDLPTEFYATILDESMGYSCGYFPLGRPSPHEDPHAVLARAQHDKFELVCGELDIGPGDRLLDVGCGWGSLAIHAAAQHGIRVTAVTISAEQQTFAAERARSLGVDHLVDFRHEDYRELTAEGHFDAAVSLEMGEHVGDTNYPLYARTLARSVRPGARVLVQQMSRTGRHPGGGPFIESFIAPDMSMRPPGVTLDLLAAAGLEPVRVRAMREHYAWTAEQWRRRFLRARESIVHRWGAETARVWDLYLTGGTRSFAEGRMGVEQFVLRRPEGTFAV